jgi:hypothetical protein
MSKRAENCVKLTTAAVRYKYCHILGMNSADIDNKTEMIRCSFIRVVFKVRPRENLDHSGNEYKLLTFQSDDHNTTILFEFMFSLNNSN